jgi:hypothetical protein
MSEAICERCAGRNIISWYADNDVWNAVMGENVHEIICPICFAAIADKRGLSPTAWHLSRDGDTPEIDKLRVQIHKLNETLKGKEGK